MKHLASIRPHILQFGKFYPPDIGGIESVMRDICEGINERGLLCDVLCANSNASFSYEILPYARIYRAASIGKLASTAISPQLITTLRKLITPYDIIHIHLPDPMANLALFLTNLQEKIIILHWHSDIIKQKYLLKLYAPLQHWLLKRADYIIATSPKYLQESPHLRPYQHKCISIPIGIDEACFDASHANHIAPSPFTHHANTKGKKIIFALGRLARNKGFCYLIHSARYLADDYLICIGGDGALRGELARLITKHKLHDKVVLLGAIPRDNLRDYYQHCDIFILPSIQESYGVVLLEAMSASKPIISTKLHPSGADWVNLHNTSGLVIPPKDPKAIAQAINVIMQDYARFAKGARHRFLTHFTHTAMINALSSLYLYAFLAYKAPSSKAFIPPQVTPSRLQKSPINAISTTSFKPLSLASFSSAPSLCSSSASFLQRLLQRVNTLARAHHMSSLDSLASPRALSLEELEITVRGGAGLSFFTCVITRDFYYTLYISCFFYIVRAFFMRLFYVSTSHIAIIILSITSLSHHHISISHTASRRMDYLHVA